MKKLFTAIIVIAVFSLCFGSCSGCSSDKDKGTDTIPMFVKADTMEVLNLVEQYLDKVRNKEYDAAIAMLCVMENDSVKPLGEELEEEIRVQQQTFPVLDYHVEDMEFINENNVRVTYAIEFFKKEPDSKIKNTIRLSFAPQRINAVWHLELLDRSYMR
ncbi:MAG: hypothetical protein J6B91_05600 [Prevotella sp.]|nr:hypothetical protein [Prevotella sp.]